MTITLTIEPGGDWPDSDSGWLEEVQTKLLDELTTGQLADLALRCVQALGSHAIRLEGELGELGLAP